MWTQGRGGRCWWGGGGLRGLCDVTLGETNHFGLAPGEEAQMQEILEKREDAHFEGTTFAGVSHPVVLTEAIVSSCIRNVYRIVSPGGESFFILTVIVLLFSAGKWQLEWILFSRPPGCWSSTPLVLSQRGCSPSRPDKVARPTSTYTLSHTSSSQLPSHPASVKSKKKTNKPKQQCEHNRDASSSTRLLFLIIIFFIGGTWSKKWFNYLWP